MARYAIGLIVAGFILLAVGGYSLYASNVSSSYKSTFNVLPLRYFKIAANLGGNTQIQGTFRESAGRPVTFDIMSSVQFAAFQSKQGNESLYAVQETASGTVSYTTTTQDTYYLVFRHGVDYKNTTETVTFERAYIHPDVPELVSGVVLVALGMVEAYWGLRPRQTRSAPPLPQTAPRKYW